jgi:hypothetical protein
MVVALTSVGVVIGAGGKDAVTAVVGFTNGTEGMVISRCRSRIVGLSGSWR